MFYTECSRLHGVRVLLFSTFEGIEPGSFAKVMRLHIYKGNLHINIISSYGLGIVRMMVLQNLK
jgi:hypothetical protein